jgi:hypothetical protein
MKEEKSRKESLTIKMVSFTKFRSRQPKNDFLSNWSDLIKVKFIKNIIRVR